MNIIQKIMNGEMSLPKCTEITGARILTVDGEAGTAEIEFVGRETFCNPVGNIQGGFLCAMLDDTMGITLSSMLTENEFAPTLEIKVQFLAPAKTGKIVGKGRVLSKGKQVCFIEGELHQDDQLLAKASSTAVIRRAVDKFNYV